MKVLNMAEMTINDYFIIIGLIFYFIPTVISLIFINFFIPIDLYEEYALNSTEFTGEFIKFIFILLCFIPYKNIEFTIDFFQLLFSKDDD